MQNRQFFGGISSFVLRNKRIFAIGLSKPLVKT